MRQLREFTPEMVAQIAARREISDPIAEASLPRIMAYLDRCGATFETVDDVPGWYVVYWSDPDVSDEPCRWACSTEFWCLERIYARAFKNRVEAGRRN